MSGPRRKWHPADLTRREALLFEAGIKLGGVFHQYLGIPVRRRTSRSLARTIEEALTLQPYVARAEVRIDPSRGGALGQGRFGYRYLTAEMLDVRVHLADGPWTVTAHLSHRKDLRYPLMRVERASRVVTVGPRPRRTGGRSVRGTSRSAGSAGGRRTPRARGPSSRRRGSSRRSA